MIIHLKENLNLNLQGNRWYFLGEKTICLKGEFIEELKAMAKSKTLDSSFVSSLLTAVFTDDVLKESSAGGGQSNFNKVSHKALDSVKLKFIKGIF